MMLMLMSVLLVLATMVVMLILSLVFMLPVFCVCAYGDVDDDVYANVHGGNDIYVDACDCVDGDGGQLPGLNGSGDAT